MIRKNEKRLKKISVDCHQATIKDYGDMTGPEALEFFEGLTQAINDVPSEYRDNVTVEPGFSGGDDYPKVELTVRYWRYETGAEQQAREEWESGAEKRREKMKEINERAEYERLKIKYGETQNAT
jgi:hypothetical protein